MTEMKLKDGMTILQCNLLTQTISEVKLWDRDPDLEALEDRPQAN